MTPVLRLASLSACSALLFACAQPPGDSRYAMDRDAAPLKSISADSVVDAVPRADPILAVGNKSPYTVNGQTYSILSEHRGYVEEGIASWYGAKFDGYETSNGEIFNLYEATAAHKTLPIPVYARVTNLDNGASIVVRVNDRGPFHSERLIDLSYAAAVKLGFKAHGTAPVRVEVIDVPGVDDRRSVPLGSYRYLQLGAFGSEQSAQRLSEQLQTIVDTPVAISPVLSGNATLFRVRLGPVKDAEELNSLRHTLQVNGFDPGQPLP